MHEHPHRPRDRAPALDHGHQLHPVVGGLWLAADQLALVPVPAQDRRPAARPGIARAGPVRPQLDRIRTCGAVYDVARHGPQPTARAGRARTRRGRSRAAAAASPTTRRCCAAGRPSRRCASTTARPFRLDAAPRAAGGVGGGARPAGARRRGVCRRWQREAVAAAATGEPRCGSCGRRAGRRGGRRRLRAGDAASRGARRAAAPRHRAGLAPARDRRARPAARRPGCCPA